MYLTYVGVVCVVVCFLVACFGVISYVYLWVVGWLFWRIGFVVSLTLLGKILWITRCLFPFVLIMMACEAAVWCGNVCFVVVYYLST